MKNRYDNTPGKDAAMQNLRQKRFESEHSVKNSFVKKQQGELSKYSGVPPKLKGEAMEFNAYMCNNGMEAQKFAKDLTKGIDNVAFPVKSAQGDDS